MGASWKTTLSAAVSAGASFVLFASQPPFSIHFPSWLAAIAMFAMVGGLAGLGIVAKDSDVTGGTVVQPGIPVAPVTPVAPSIISLSQAVHPASSPATKPPAPSKW
jgi:hypothetical protein